MNQTAVSEGTVSAIVAKVLSQLSVQGEANAPAGTIFISRTVADALVYRHLR